MSKPGTLYQCAQCLETYERTIHDSEAWKEYLEFIPQTEMPTDPVLVCDDCFKAMTEPDKYPLLVEKAHFVRECNQRKQRNAYLQKRARLARRSSKKSRTRQSGKGDQADRANDQREGISENGSEAG